VICPFLQNLENKDFACKILQDKDLMPRFPGIAVAARKAARSAKLEASHP
jgi:TolA-binding protein